MSLSLIKSLARLHLITPLGLYTIIRCFMYEGITLMAALRFSAKYYPENTAIVSEKTKLTYRQLYHQARNLSKFLWQQYQLKEDMRVALFCRNHHVSSILLPALSRLGVKIKLINTDICESKIKEIAERQGFKLFIHDEEFSDRIQSDILPFTCISTESIKEISAEDYHHVKLPKVKRGGDISIFTGGSSGKYSEAARRTGVIQFLSPFIALIERIKIQNYNSVLIALPFYHGFGLATWIISLVMGKKICLMRHFDATEALQMILNERIEVLPVVPAILSRIWQQPNAHSMMQSVRCIISGGDRLNKRLVEQTHNILGPICYNLYGTTEAGLLMLATPDDLDNNKETTIGRPIRGVCTEIRNISSEDIGTLWVKCSCAMLGEQDHWQATSDLVFKNNDGYYFHKGRADSMIVCGGENVFPGHVEQIINGHPSVIQSMVYAVEDPKFGNVLNAQVELKTDMHISDKELKQWLRQRLSRPEMPHHIIFREFSLLSTGKISKQRT
ncbi:AMP-binding protein [Prevotella koreensis]|uniref:AMP-binding protein n=1 Tax=Prevotella koreensis TaxID=2490854 RepID=UPI0028F0B3C6|nr:AMP-binding protein [Prevotella koreensis]